MALVRCLFIGRGAMKKTPRRCLLFVAKSDRMVRIISTFDFHHLHDTVQWAWGIEDAGEDGWLEWGAIKMWAGELNWHRQRNERERTQRMRRN